MMEFPLQLIHYLFQAPFYHQHLVLLMKQVNLASLHKEQPKSELQSARAGVPPFELPQQGV
jgi:hypothetical protein